MKSKNVPSCFWGEAVATAVYILNRAPTKSLDGITPYEAWHGKKPRVNHMRVFGCIAHVKKIGPGVKKLSDRSQRMVFIGYEEGTKGYRLLDPVTRTLHISRDVIFEENLGWEWNNAESLNQPEFVITEHSVTVGGPTIESEAADAVPNSPAVGSPVGNQFQPSSTDTQGSTSVHTPDTQTPPTQEVNQWATPPQGQSVDSEGAPLRYKTLSELFDETHEVEDYEYSNMCLLAADEPVSVDEALEEECWKSAMETEL